LVADCTEWYEGSHLPGGRFGLVHFENEMRMRYLLPRVKNVIVISTFLEKYYAAKNCNLIKLPVLVDLNQEKWINKLSLEGSNNRNYKEIIYAGDPGKKDILILIVQALEFINKNDIKIVFKIIGISEMDLLKLGLKPSSFDFVICLGKVNLNEVPSHYFKSDYSILLRENKQYAHAGFSTKFVESLSCGIPVIANLTSDIGYYLNQENGYLIYKLTKSSLIRVFEEILKESHDVYIYKKHKAYDLALNNFHYSNYSFAFANFLKSI
jgi:glycosyltransferase involved in cell wall biosynthesis